MANTHGKTGCGDGMSRTVDAHPAFLQPIIGCMPRHAPDGEVAQEPRRETGNQPSHSLGIRLLIPHHEAGQLPLPLSLSRSKLARTHRSRAIHHSESKQAVEFDDEAPVEE